MVTDRRDRKTQKSRAQWILAIAITVTTISVAVIAFGRPTRSTRDLAPSDRLDRTADSRARSAGLSPGVRDIIDRFVEGFQVLTDEACVKSLGVQRCERRRGYSADADAEALQASIQFAAEEVPTWLRASDLLDPPVRAVPPLQRFLSSAMTGPDAPFSVMVGLAVYRWIPALTDRAILEELVTAPGKIGVRWLAFEALLANPGAVPVEFLRNSIRDDDSRIARRSLAVLGRRPDGAHEIRNFLAEREYQMPQDMQFALGKALVSADLARDSELMAQLMESSDSAVRFGALEAAAQIEPGELDANLLPRLAQLAVEPSDERLGNVSRANALSALARNDPTGEALFSIAARGEVSLRLRATALELLGDSDRATRMLLSLLPGASTAADAFVISRAAAANQLFTVQLSDAVLGWCESHPNEVEDLTRLLAGSRSEVLREFAVRSGLQNAEQN